MYFPPKNEWNKSHIEDLSEKQIISTLNESLQVGDYVTFAKGGQQDYSIYLGQITEILSRDDYPPSVGIKTLETGRYTSRSITQVHKLDPKQITAFKQKHPELFI